MTDDSPALHFVIPSEAEDPSKSTCREPFSDRLAVFAPVYSSQVSFQINGLASDLPQPYLNGENGHGTPTGTTEIELRGLPSMMRSV